MGCLGLKVKLVNRDLQGRLVWVPREPMEQLEQMGWQGNLAELDPREQGERGVRRAFLVPPGPGVFLVYMMGKICVLTPALVV